MRYVSAAFQESTLRRGRSLEQFLGGGTRNGEPIIRIVELRPCRDGHIEVWLHQARDVGDEDHLDYGPFVIYEDEDQNPVEPLASGLDVRAALDLAERQLGAIPARWTNQGVAQDEYLDFIRACRPKTWPPEAE